MLEHIIKEYDIRGIYHKDISNKNFYILGQKLASKIKKESKHPWTAIVGSDNRYSSGQLKFCLILGLKNSGIDVIDVGTVPTPLLNFYTVKEKAIVGIQVTGSHNPPEHNGAKILFNNKPLFGEELKELNDYSINSDNIFQRPGTTFHENLKAKKFYTSEITNRISDIGNKKILWDLSNGVVSEILEDILKNYRNENYFINQESNGNFPNHLPDPTREENLEQIRTLLIGSNYDYGIAFDGDGDRVVFLDKHGETLSPNLIISFFSKVLKLYKEDFKQVCCVKTSNYIYKNSKENTYISRTGHANIKNLMIENEIDFGGELSGHYFFKDWYYIDDGIFTALLFLYFIEQYEDLFYKTKNEMSNIISSGEYRLQCQDKEKLMEDIKNTLIEEKYDYSKLDGVKIFTEYGWFLIRKSNTEEKISLVFESEHNENYNNLRNLIFGKFLADEGEKR